MFVFLVELTDSTILQIVTDNPAMVAEILDASRFVTLFRVVINGIPQYEGFKGYYKSEKRLRSV